MSVFSDMLQNYVHEKDVKVSALASYCDMERSTFYKFITANGSLVLSSWWSGLLLL